jgi:hypothetical protein
MCVCVSLSHSPLLCLPLSPTLCFSP